MRILHALGRVAFGAPFIVLGLDAVKEPGPRVKAVEKLGIPQPELVVRANGAAMVAGGAALAAGVLPRAAAGGLVLSLIPTTQAGHPFWSETDPAKRVQQRIHFLKNVGLAGALLAYAFQR